jgi:hypothetical protein
MSASSPIEKPMVATNSPMAMNETGGGGISLEIYWLSSLCRLSQEQPFKGQIEEKPRKPMTKSYRRWSRQPLYRDGRVEVRAREYLTNAEVDRLIKPPGPTATAIATSRSPSMAVRGPA